MRHASVTAKVGESCMRGEPGSRWAANVRYEISTSARAVKTCYEILVKQIGVGGIRQRPTARTLQLLTLLVALAGVLSSQRPSSAMVLSDQALSVGASAVRPSSLDTHRQYVAIEGESSGASLAKSLEVAPASPGIGGPIGGSDSSQIHPEHSLQYYLLYYDLASSLASRFLLRMAPKTSPPAACS